MLLLIRLFISLVFFCSSFQTLKICVAFFSETVRPIKLKLDTYTWKVGGCIVYTAVRLLLLICPLFLHFSFSPLFKN